MQFQSHALLLLATVTSALAPPQVKLNNEDQNTTEHLHVSAVVHDPNPPHAAKIECWELAAPFLSYPTIGSSFLLSNTTNLTYVSLPPRSIEGLHHPPHPMLFTLLKGIAHVGLPGDPSSDGLWIVEGVNPVIVATDTLGIGHFTYYPSSRETVALQAPFKDGVVPEHRAIAEHACSDSTEPNGEYADWIRRARKYL